jgi:hypothetical protein
LSSLLWRIPGPRSNNSRRKYHYLAKNNFIVYKPCSSF